MDPTSELLDLPAVYGHTTKKLAWPTVRAELEASKEYWLCTVRGDGRPHVVALSGIWVDDVWFYSGSPDTVHYRTVLANPEAVMHLPDPFRVVIVEGEVRRTQNPPELAARLARASNEKYPDFGVNDASAFEKTFGLHPRRVLAWMSFPTDATRFLF